jgi:DNA processing protein
MSAADERAATVALLRNGRRPWVEYAELLEEYGSALAILEQDLSGQPLGESAQTSLLPASNAGPNELLDQARADLNRWDARGMRLITVLDPEYPPNLRAVHDRPPVVFVGGRLTPADARGVAVVGARQATKAGLHAATAIAHHLVTSGYAVVSGLAAGIDTAAHTSALAAGGRTIGVIGTGLARVYPPENASLQCRIAEECAVISQFWPDSPPSRRSFPMRNAVMSGVALATVVVEASETSGARMQARLALAQARPVFLLASLAERQAWARDHATRPGVYVISEPAEISATLERLIAVDPLLA